MRNILLCAAAMAALILVTTPASGADFYVETVTLPTDAGHAVSTAIGQGGIQLAVQSPLDVNYRVCERDTRGTDGGFYHADAGPIQGSCIPTSNDLMIEANKIFDVPLPNGWKHIAFVRADGGAPAVRVYRVHPRTLPE